MTAKERLRILARELRQAAGIELVPEEVAVSNPHREGQCRIIPSLEGCLRTWYGKRAGNALRKAFDEENKPNLDFVQDLANFAVGELCVGVPTSEELAKIPRLAAIM